MIDTVIRSKGIGGSEIAAICGMDPRRDKFAVYAEKLGLVDRAEPNSRMRWGKLIEKVIAEAYAEETKQTVVWLDETMSHPDRSWQVFTPDAFVWAPSGPLQKMNPVGGVDSKNIAWDQAHLWDRDALDVSGIPESIALQCQWYCSGADLPWWDVAALFGGSDLRIYRVTRDPEIEGVLLKEGERFWVNNVLAKNPPPIGGSETAAAYLKKRFPKNVTELRPAEGHDVEILSTLKDIRQKYDKFKALKKSIENEVKQAIGDADGLLWGKDKVTYKLCKSTMGTDWEAVARDIADLVILERAPSAGADLARIVDGFLSDFAKTHEVIVKQGSRRLIVPRAWKAEDEDEE